jgi:hypothetical protein
VSLQPQLCATLQTTFVLTGILAVARAFPQTLEPSISVLLAQAATYEQQFEREFSTMVGQEHYEQRWSGFSQGLDSSPNRQRVMESEVLFVWLPEEESWLTAPNARIVDDSPVPDSESRLERLLAAPANDLVARVRSLRDESARFNLGPVERNFNDPTMVVQFLSAKVQPRLRFERRGRDTIDGTLVMQERYERSRDQVDCVATYTDFRRFETTGRLVPR